MGQTDLPLNLQVREEAGELCQTLEQGEGQERAASEMADLLYHAMVLLKAQVSVENSSDSCMAKLCSLEQDLMTGACAGC